MAQLILAQWTINWGGVQLLVGGSDFTEGEIKLPAGGGHYQEIAPARGQYVVRMGRQLLVQRMSFRKHTRCVNAAQARIILLTSIAQLNNVALQTGLAPDTTMKALTGGIWRLGNCKASWVSEVYADRAVLDFQLEFGAVTLVTAPPDPNPPASLDTLVTDDGKTIVTNTGAVIGVNPG